MIEDKLIFEHLIESMQEGVLFVNEANKLIYCNTNARKLLPLDIERLVGQDILECHIREKRDAALKIIEKFRSKQRTNYQHVRQIKGKYFEDRIYPVRNPAGDYMGLLIIMQDVTKQKKLEDEVRSLSIKDGLTGLYNLRHFYQELSREIARFKRKPGYNISLLFFDVDHFKQYNDKYGHKLGDEVIKKVADVAAKATRKNVDSVFRYGGDEFAMILADTSQENALIVAERLRTAYAAANTYQSTLSIGVIAYDPAMDIDTFIERADQSMYAAKFAGGNRVYLYQPQVVPNTNITE